MWHACAVDIKPETKPVCTLQYDEYELLRKHLAANIIYYQNISPEYQIFKDGSLRYTVWIGDTPLRRSRLPGIIIGSIIVLLAIAGVVWIIFALTPNQ